MSSAASYWESPMCGVFFAASYCESPLVGCTAAASYWGSRMCRVFFCSRLLCGRPIRRAYFCKQVMLGKFHLQDLVPMQHAIWNVPFVGTAYAASYWENPFVAFSSAASYLESPVCSGPLIWRLRPIIYLKHAPLFGSSVSSYLKCAPSFGDSRRALKQSL